MNDWHTLKPALVALGGVSPTATLALLVVVALGLRGAWRHALVFVAMLLTVVAIDVADKMLYYAWGVDYGWAVFRAASGHAARSAAVYPTLGWVVFAGSSRWRCVAGVAVGCVIAAAVSFSSVDSGIHTAAEVCVGALLGLTTLLVVARLASLKPLAGAVQMLLIVAAIAACMFVPATRYDFESHVQKTARRLVQ